jgi:AraC-like DNA-binding protein
MVGQVATRGVYVEPAALPHSFDRCRVVGVSPLLRSLLVEAVDLPLADETDTRAGQIMGLILHELATLAELPLWVPFPADARLARRCRQFLRVPAAHDTIEQWADALHMSRRGFTRLFRRETGLSLAAWRQRACVAASLPRLMSGEAVTTVAIDQGYDPGGFTAMFRRVLGSSPRAYVSMGDTP